MKRHSPLIGGNSPAAARRAARLGLMFSPAVDDAALAERLLLDACVIQEEAPKASPVVHEKISG